MSPIPIWFERKFEFSFPAQQFPNLCARLRGTPARVEEILLGVPREIITRKPEEKWSAQEHAGHLLDLDPLWLTRALEFRQGNVAELSPADLTNRRTHAANHNGRPVEEILAEFREARGKLLECLEQFEAPTATPSIPHPRLKTPMRLVDHLYFVAEHDDHHLAHIWALARV
jgi:uncharacterized damage-inducible protein DinB